MLALTEKEQALFVGLRAGFYRLAMIFGSGFLVYVAGMLETSSSDIARSWSTVMVVVRVDLRSGCGIPQVYAAVPRG